MAGARITVVVTRSATPAGGTTDVNFAAYYLLIVMNNEERLAAQRAALRTVRPSLLDRLRALLEGSRPGGIAAAA